MASNILPSTDYTRRSHSYPVIQHRNQPPCGIRAMKHQYSTAPNPKHLEGKHTWQPPLPQSAGECSSPSSHRPLPKLAFTPYILHSKMQKSALSRRLMMLSEFLLCSTPILPLLSDQPTIRESL